MFGCIVCEYSTNNSSHFREHLLAKSHYALCSKGNACHLCFKKDMTVVIREFERRLKDTY